MADASSDMPNSNTATPAGDPLHGGDTYETTTTTVRTVRNHNQPSSSGIENNSGGEQNEQAPSKEDVETLKKKLKNTIRFSKLQTLNLIYRLSGVGCDVILMVVVLSLLSANIHEPDGACDTSLILVLMLIGIPIGFFRIVMEMYYQHHAIRSNGLRMAGYVILYLLYIAIMLLLIFYKPNSADSLLKLFTEQLLGHDTENTPIKMTIVGCVLLIVLCRI